MERPISALFVLIVAAVASDAQVLFAGDRCTSDGVSGVCRRIDSCPSALEDFSRGKIPIICSYDKRTPVVCCISAAPSPTTTTTTTTTARITRTTSTTTTPRTLVDRGGEGNGQKAQKMCERYAQAVWREEALPTLVAIDDDDVPERINKSYCSVPYTAQLIIGGEPADPKEFPHMAAIGFGDGKNVAWLCGGSLISERYILTAAHCVSAGNRGLARWVRLGDLNLVKTNDDARPQQIAVEERIRHPGYSALSHYDDIALLRLARAATFTPYVRPACLHIDRRATREYFLASGWGLTDWADDVGSDDLMKVQLYAVSPADCSKTYRSLIGTTKLKFGIQDNKMLCAGGEKGKDTCRGDSGGPLQFVLEKPECMYSIAGVTSFGSTVCGARSSPAVYTRVSNYVPWIESVVWP